MPYPMFSFSAEDLRKYGACFLPVRIKDMNNLRGQSISEKEKISANVWWSLPSTNDVGSIWSFQLDYENGERAAVKVALFCTTSLLPSFTQLYPEDNRPQKAIELIEAWLDNPADKNARSALSAASANMRDTHLSTKNLSPPDCSKVNKAQDAFDAAYKALSAATPHRGVRAAQYCALKYFRQCGVADLHRFINSLYGLL